jgi:hypothetical protein
MKVVFGISKVVLGIFAVVLAVPLLLVVAVGLGPVILGILCAVGFGLIVFVVGNLAIGLVIGLGLLVRSVERAGSRYVHHAQIPQT